MPEATAVCLAFPVLQTGLSGKQDSHVGIYWQELGCWFPDPCMTQLHIVLHPTICLAYLCAFAGSPFPSPPMDPLAAFKNVCSTCPEKHSMTSAC